MPTTRTRQQQGSNAHTAGLVHPSAPTSARSPAHRGLAIHFSNQAMQQELTTKTIQTKLSVNEPGDAFEQDADRVSDMVMRMPEDCSLKRTRIQRSCAHCHKELDVPHVQRLCAECDERLQGKRESNRPPEITPRIEARIGALSGGGQPLKASSRTFFESRFGHDFRDVRVHSDGNAAETARSINALAYTSGQHVVFAPGQYSPDTNSGKRLLAHELTHTIQQGHAPASATLGIQRLGDLKERPAGLACPTPPGRAPGPLVELLFPNKGTVLTPPQRGAIQAFALKWNAAGRASRVRVDGYASPLGSDKLNWELSCQRAQAVANELTSPSTPGTPAVPNSMMDVFAQGETSEFSTTGGTDPDGANRRAAINSLLPSPAPTPTSGPGPQPTPPTTHEPTPATPLCPGVPTVTPADCADRHDAYCDAQSCFRTNPWLDCACTASEQVCDAIDAFNFSGISGSVLEACVEVTHATTPFGIGFIKNDVKDKGDWFRDANRCIWGQWRAAFDALHDPTRPIPSSVTPEWSAAITTCRASGVASSACCKSEVIAEQTAIDRCTPYDSLRFGKLPTDVPSSPECSRLVAPFAPGPPFTGDFGKVADRITYGTARCCP